MAGHPQYKKKGNGVIYATGHRKPTPEERREVRKRGDDTFTSRLPVGFLDTFEVDGWTVDDSTGIALRMRDVEPHRDDWHGLCPVPEKQASIFWLMDRRLESVWVQVGNDACRIGCGGWVIFDHSVMHCVIAARKWSGCAYQLRPA